MRRRYINISLNILLLLAVLSVFLAVKSEAKALVPDITEFRLPLFKVLDDDDKLINQGDILRLREAFPETIVTGYYCEHAYIYTIDEKKAPVTVVYADEFFDKAYNLEIIRGVFFESMEDSALNPVIISSDLAKELFMTEEAIGITVKINGENYKIAGLYKDDGTFMGRVSGDNYNYVCVPNTRFYDFSSDVDIEVLAIENSFDMYSMSQKTAEKLEVYDRVDYGETIRLLFSFKLPKRFIPEGNIFDLGFYYDRFIELLNGGNTVYNDGGYYLSYINVLTGIVSVLWVLFLVLIVGLVCNIIGFLRSWLSSFKPKSQDV